jgi:transcription factor CP2-like protein
MRFLSLYAFFKYLYYFTHSDKKEHIMLDGTVLSDYGTPIKRQRITPPLSERVMLYVRQDNEDVYTPLHVIPPTTNGLISAVS